MCAPTNHSCCRTYYDLCVPYRCPPPPSQIIASTLDSVLDIISGGLLYMSNRATLKLDKHKYPQGKSRCVGVPVFCIGTVHDPVDVDVDVSLFTTRWTWMWMCHCSRPGGRGCGCDTVHDPVDVDVDVSLCSGWS